MDRSQLMAFLQSLTVGELAGIRTKLDQAREACIEIEQGDLAEKLHQAERALDDADMRTYRKRVETVIARLGHVRQ
jgi:hypothetical protein